MHFIKAQSTGWEKSDYENGLKSTISYCALGLLLYKKAGNRLTLAAQDSGIGIRMQCS